MKDGDALPALVPVLMSVGKIYRHLVTLKLAPLGVETGQDSLLDALSPDRPRSVAYLSRALLVRPSTVSKMTSRFEAKGWAVREDGKVDKRLVLVRLTEDGAAVRAAVRAVWAALEHEIAAGLADQAEPAAEALSRVEAVLAKRLSRARV